MLTIPFTLLLQSGLILGLVTLFGLLLKFITDRQNVKLNERIAFVNSILDEVKSLRSSTSETNRRLDTLQTELNKARSDLLECILGRAELSRQIVELRTTITMLEGRIRTDEHVVQLGSNLQVLAQVKAIADAAQHRETLAEVSASHATARTSGEKADLAYEEANSVNVKLARIEANLATTLSELRPNG